MDVTEQNKNNLILYSSCGLVSRSIKTAAALRNGIMLLCIAGIFVAVALIIFSLSAS